MMDGGIRELQPGSIEVSGQLNNATALNIRRKGEGMIANASAECRIDFEAVTQVDTVAVSVMLCWLRYSNQLNKTIVFLNLPKALLDIIKVGGLEATLPLTS